MNPSILKKNDEVVRLFQYEIIPNLVSLMDSTHTILGEDSFTRVLRHIKTLKKECYSHKLVGDERNATFKV